MDDRKLFVFLDTDQYEELISRSTQLSIIKKAYMGMKSYQFEELLKVLFGTKEDDE